MRYSLPEPSALGLRINLKPSTNTNRSIYKQCGTPGRGLSATCALPLRLTVAAAHLAYEVEVGLGAAAPRRLLCSAALHAGRDLRRRQAQAGVLLEADAPVLRYVPTGTLWD